MTGQTFWLTCHAIQNPGIIWLITNWIKTFNIWVFEEEKNKQINAHMCLLMDRCSYTEETDYGWLLKQLSSLWLKNSNKLGEAHIPRQRSMLPLEWGAPFTFAIMLLEMCKLSLETIYSTVQKQRYNTSVLQIMYYIRTFVTIMTMEFKF